MPSFTAAFQTASDADTGALASARGRPPGGTGVTDGTGGTGGQGTGAALHEGAEEDMSLDFQLGVCGVCVEQ